MSAVPSTAILLIPLPPLLCWEVRVPARFLGLFVSGFVATATVESFAVFRLFDPPETPRQSHNTEKQTQHRPALT